MTSLLRTKWTTAIPKLPPSALREQTAVVVSSGLMAKTVKVRVGTQKWNKHIQKNFNHTAHHLVHDPASSLRTGDIISISSGWRVSKNVHHVVNKILAPFGDPVEARPPVPSVEERVRDRLAKREEKIRRRVERRGLLGKKEVERGVEAAEGEEFEVDSKA